MQNEQLYNIRYDFWQETYKIFKSLFLSYLIVLFFLFVIEKNKDYLSFITIYFSLIFFLIPISKRLLKYFLFKKLKLIINVSILGNKEQANILKKEFLDNWYLGLNPVNKNFNIVYIASKGIEYEKLYKLIYSFMDKKYSVFIIPYLADLNFVHSPIMEYFNIRYNAIRIENQLLLKKNLFLKNFFDYLLTLILLPLFLIMHIFISFAIKKDSKGPIFFIQTRVGKNGKLFKCYKYRTMYIDSEKILKDYLKNHPEEIEYYEKYHKYKNDPRVTKVGKFLRSLSLDELPQIINVLKGDMSLIGPRPYMPIELKSLQKDKDIILKVKPGITGLWQVSGRNNVTFKERVSLEKWYIKNYSLWIDFVIFIKTFKVVINKVGAK